MWRWLDEPWQFRVLDQLPSSIDMALLERTLAMTPAERIQAAQELMETAETLQAAMSSKRPER